MRSLPMLGLGLPFAAASLCAQNCRAPATVGAAASDVTK